MSVSQRSAVAARPRRRAAPEAVDLLFASTLVALSVLVIVPGAPTMGMGFAVGPPRRAPDLLLVVLVLLEAGPVAWRRSRPRLAAAVSSVGYGGVLALGYMVTAADFGVLVLAYSLAAYGSLRAGAVAAVAAAVGMAGLVGLVPGVRETADGLDTVVLVYLTGWVFPLGFGLARHRHLAYVAALEERAARQDTPPAPVAQVVPTESAESAMPVAVPVMVPAAVPSPSVAPVPPAPPPVPPASLDRLTPREREVFSLLALGLSNPEIADRMVVSRETVKTHVGQVLAKLGLRDRTQAAIFAHRHGLVRSEET